MAELQNHFENRVPYDIEYRLRKQDKEYCWIEVRGQAIWNEAGEAVRMAGSIADISDRKKREEELRISETSHRTLAENLPAIAYRVFPQENNRMIFFNNMVESMTGCREEELTTGRVCSIDPFILPEDRAKVIETVKEAVAKKQSFEIEYQIEDKLGSIRHFWEKGKVTQAEGEALQIDGVIFDISDRKRRESILKDIASGVTISTGTDFLPSLVSYLCQALKVDFAFIGKLIQPEQDRIRTLAVCGNGQIIDNFEYPKAGTPCKSVLEDGLRIYPEAIVQTFPDDLILQDISAESYAGITVTDSNGKDLGLIAVLDSKPCADAALTEEVLKIFATRAANELERQQAEAKNREQAALLNLTHDTVLVRNLDDTIVFWNLGAEEMYGWSADEAIGKKSHELLQAKFSQSTAEIKTELFQQDRWEGELTHQKQDGSTVIVMGRWSLLRDEAGNPQQILEINHDITRRKQAEVRIREQAALLNVATDAIMVRDLENQLLFWNQGAQRLYGWTEAEVLNHNANELLYRKSFAGFDEIWRSLYQKGQWQGELQQITKAGKNIVVESRWTLVKDQDDNPRSILVVNTDITEQKQLEAQFLRTQRLESLGTLAGGIAHDLNNILAPILGFSKLLPLKLPDVDEQTKSFFKIMENNANRGTALVKQILTFSRGLEGEKGIVQIRHLISEIAQIINETFPKSIQLETNAPKSLWTVNADINQLHQVLMNLSVNARDAMTDGGTLTINAENTTVDAEYARLHLDATVGDYVLITVSDTGVGIRPEIIDRIFEPFLTTKEVGRGTGLGLSTVIGIVQSHGGFIDVESSRQRATGGTKFKVFLPASNIAENNVEEPEADLRGNGELILVVDDETAILEVTKATLETYNYQVLTASDGIKAIATYAQNRDIDLVIMDIMMPLMDGKTAIRTIKQIDSEVKIIAVSGLIERQEIVTELDSEVVAFLNKPYSNDDLLKMLQEIFSD